MNEVRKIDIFSLKLEIEKLFYKYDKLYNIKLIESQKILEYWENEFFWWKKEAYEDILNLIKKYN